MSLLHVCRGYSKLLEVLLRMISTIEMEPWQWGAILSANVEKPDPQGVLVTLQAGADPNAPTPKSQ
jgi:hypothetical protein